jgi:very-short-patch-repair endonuclease
MTDANLSTEPLTEQLLAMAEQLTDLTRNNRALNYGENRRGGLDLAKASPEYMSLLLQGNKVSISNLFPKEDPVAEQTPEDVDSEESRPSVEGDPNALREARSQFATAATLREEKGLESYWFASHAISWDHLGKTYRAPMFVMPAVLEKEGNGGNFNVHIDVTANPLINPSLATYFKVVFDLEFASQVDLESEDDIQISRLEEYSRQIAEVAGTKVTVTQIPDFRVLDNFNFTMLPMIKDLESQEFMALVQSNAVIMAMLDLDHASLTSELVQPIAESELDLESPGQLPLIADANASQLVAIKSILNGSHLLIQGPPGTGKSQTIANTIALLSSQGKRTLFVAEKRAAILAVSELLDEHGLGHLMLPLNSENMNRSTAMSRIQQNLDRASSILPPNLSTTKIDQLHSTLMKRQQLLNEVIPPTNRKLIDLIGYSSLLPSNLNLDSILQSKSGDWIAYAENEFQLVKDLAYRMKISGFLESTSSQSSWSTINISSNTAFSDFEEELRRCQIEEISPESRRCLEGLKETVLEEARIIYSPLFNYARAEEQISTELSDAEVYEYAKAFDLEPINGRTFRGDGGFFDRIRKRREFRKLLSTVVPPRDAIKRLAAARIEIEDTSLTPPPRNMIQTYIKAGELLDRISGFYAKYALTTPTNLGEAMGTLAHLLQDLSGFSRTQEWSDLRFQLSAIELDQEKLPLFASGGSQADAERLLRGVIAGRITRAALRAKPELSVVDPSELSLEFCQEDKAVFSTGAQRVAFASAQWTKRRREEDPDADRMLRTELAKRRRGKTIRRLFHEIPNTVTAVNPCVAMSPLQVSSYLPRTALFDVVIFDEASQVAPVEAITALARGRQIVVAGDKHQLPPTNFFSTSIADGAVALADTESVLKRLEILLPNQWLNIHYRSQDDRLIKVSAEHVYWEMSRLRLKTIPSAIQARDCLRFVQVNASDTTPQGTRTSGDSEIAIVVEEILKHATSQPEKSLGVIAFSADHATRIELALDRARQSHRDLDGFFSQDGKKKFFVKNIERVQGDERDVIFISTGYQKNAAGQLPQNFGPVNNGEGGYRRVNVMISRAKVQMVLFSSFNSGDIRIKGASSGVQLLHHFFRFVETGGEVLANAQRHDQEMNPFELSIYEELIKRGIEVTPQLGVSGYWIDFALIHPERPGAYVLAVEADGASYHSTPTARERDRLRQEHLEAKGFRFHRVWSTDWFRDRAAEIDRIVESFNQAVDSFDEKGLLIPSPSSSHAAVTVATRPSPVPSNAGRWRGVPIDQIPLRELDALMRSAKIENPSKPKDEIVEIVFAGLGYGRRGSRVMAALRKSFDRT